MSRIVVLIFFNLILLAWFSMPPSGLAANLRLLGDWTYTNTDSETKDRLTQERTDSESRRFSQIYRLDVNQELSPTLFLNGGAQLEDNDLRSESDEGKTRTEGTTVRPYVDLQWQMPLFTLSGGYEEREAKTKTGGETLRDFAETTTARYYWRPVDLPSLELDYARTLRYDEPLTHDNESQVFRLSSKYRWEDWEFLYGYLRSDEEEKIADTEALTQTHNGRVRYARNFYDNRLAVNAGARMERSTVEFSGAKRPSIRTFPIGAGFFLLNDPDPIDTNLALTPYTPTNETPFNTINLGPGGPSTPISLGLDFGEDIRVDSLEVLLQTDTLTLDQLTSTSFDFRVFISDDQENWIEIGATQILNELDSLYRIDLASQVSTRYIKVTTYALPTSAGSTIGDIRVSDVRAFVTPPADVTEITSTYQSLNAGFSWKATEKTQVLFDSSYQYRETDLFDDARARLSHSLSLIHRFNPIFSGTTRLLRSDAWEQWKHDTATTSYSAQLSGRYLPTLNQSLTYSAMRSEEPEGKSVSNAVILRTNATLYRGWDLSFDQGYNWQDPITGKDTSAFFVRLQNSLIPHPRFTLIADYSIRWEQKEDEPTERGETGRVRATWSPTDNLSLNGEVRQRRSEDEIYTYWEYGAGWLPFRDGTLQLNLTYYEDGDTNEDWRRSFSPSLIWSVTDSATLRVLYNLGRQEVRDEMTDYQSVMVNFRIYIN